jgi:type II secretory pathway component PulJ
MLILDCVIVALLLLATTMIFSSARDIKRLLSEARYERMDLHRRIEAMTRRLDKIERGDRSDQAERAA